MHVFVDFCYRYLKRNICEYIRNTLVNLVKLVYVFLYKARNICIEKYFCRVIYISFPEYICESFCEHLFISRLFWAHKYPTWVNVTWVSCFLPLKAWIMACRVSRDIPLCPLARTLILRASSMRVRSGLNGFPTPTHTAIMQKHVQRSLQYFVRCTDDNEILKSRRVWVFYLLSVNAPGSPAALCGTKMAKSPSNGTHEKRTFNSPTI